MSLSYISFSGRSVCRYTVRVHIRVHIYIREKLFSSYCSGESLIASISRPESTVSKLFGASRFFGAPREKKGARILPVAATRFRKTASTALRRHGEENRKIPAVNCTFARQVRLSADSFRDRVARERAERRVRLMF